MPLPVDPGHASRLPQPLPANDTQAHHDMSPTEPLAQAPSRQPARTSALITAYVITLVSACCLEAIWYLGIAEAAYERELKGLLVAQFSLAPAAAFYVFYALGATYFATAHALQRDSLLAAVTRGGAYGFCCFSAHNFTDLADIQGYSAYIVAIDIPWGVFMSATTCALGFIAARRLNRRDTSQAAA